jgi:hypothetical protein
MSTGTVIGIDFGGLDLRAAYAHDGIVTSYPVEHRMRDERIVFDTTHSISSLGVSFPSVYDSIGADVSILSSEQVGSPESILQERLRSVRDHVMKVADAPPVATAIAVPAALTERRRQILLDCAAQAGLANAALIDRPLAVALGMRADKDHSATYVVYHLGYSDCEYALVRVARGRCWTVGSAHAPRISGQRLDALVMEDMILALRDKQIFPGLKHLGLENWHQLRHQVEQLRLKLGEYRPVAMQFGPALSGPNAAITIRLEAGDYARAVTTLVTSTVDGVNSLLEQHGLENTNVDAVLLVGEEAQRSPIRDVIGYAFPKLAVLTPPDLIAFGAVAYASETEGMPLSLPTAYRSTTEFKPKGLELKQRSRSEAGASATPTQAQFSLVARVEREQKRRPPSGKQHAAESRDRVQVIRELLAQKRHHEAQSLLVLLAADVEQLQRELGNGRSHAQELILQAHGRLLDGFCVDAVQLAHRAYELEPTDVGIFAAMMKIHAEAGLALDRPEQYEQAVQLLACAHRHDATDRTIHRALAERHYRHAVTMKHLNNFERALAGARSALSYDPKHDGANQLLEQLSASMAMASSHQKSSG